MRAEGIAAIAEDDPEARGDTALAMELRRTIGWIRFCEDQIAAMGRRDAAFSAEHDDVDNSEFLGSKLGALGLVSRETAVGEDRDFSTDLVKETWSAGVNVWEEKLRWNRAHLVTVTKQWIAAGFEARRLELEERTLIHLERAIDGIVRDLGHNPHDPAVRRIVRDRLYGLAADAAVPQQAALTGAAS